MKQLLIYFVLGAFGTTILYSQVGVGTTSPNATLDIRSSDQASPTNTDGILIPKVDEFPLTNPTAIQDGMLIFATGSGTPIKGFYYWDQSSTSWIALSGTGGDVDWLEQGSSNDPDDINDNIYTLGNVSIGQSGIISYPLYIDATTNNTAVRTDIGQIDNAAKVGYDMRLSNTGSGQKIGFFAQYIGGGNGSRIGFRSQVGGGSTNSNPYYGAFHSITTTGTGLRYGSYQSLSGNGSGNQYGSYNTLTGSGSATKYGVYNNLAGGSGDKYGIYTRIADGQPGNHYGVYSDILKSGSFAAYFLGDVSIGTTSSNNYIMPSSRGADGEIIRTDGTGNLSWVDPISLDDDSINNLSDGKSDNDGTDNGSSIFLGVGAGINDNGTNNGNIGIGFLSLNSHVDGIANTAVGYATLQNSNLTSNNNAFGAFALNSNTSGTSNSAFGYSALFSNIDGSGNLAFGFRSLDSNTSGNSNVAIGNNTLASNNTGNNNVAIGPSAGSSISTGDGNVFLGYYAGFAESGSNKLYIENSTSTPLIYGEFDNDFLQINGTLDINGAYSFPTFAGSTGQVLVYNGSGQLNWQLFSDVDDDSINNLSDGKTDTNQTSVYLGAQAGQNDDDSSNRNVGIGSFALFDNADGEQNIAIGNRALTNNIDGDNNVAIGDIALTNNSSGNENTALGVGALSSSTISSGNTAIGFYSLTSNTDGVFNTAVGSWSMNSTSTGYGNTALGSYAMSANESGIGNVALGSEALFSNTTGHSNIAIGINALYSSFGGDSNVAIGFEALYANLNNGSNVAIGSEALRNNSGINNTVVGHNSGRDSGIGSGNVFLGYQSGFNETGSSKLYIENSSANSNNALIYGEFDNDLLRLNGRTEITATTDASGTVGSGALEIANALRIDGNEIITNTNSTLFIQNDNNGDVEMDAGTFRMDASTNRVGIGTTNPQDLLHINGTVRIGNETIRDAGNDALRINAALLPDLDDTNVLGNSTQRWRTLYAVNGTINTSDRREKKNITDLNYGLKEILKMKPVSFNWKNDKNPKLKLGLIAQELLEIIPEVVVTHEWKSEDNYETNKNVELDRLGVYYSDLIPVLINAIQEQQVLIKELKNSISKKELQSQKQVEILETLLLRIENLEQVINQ